LDDVALSNGGGIAGVDTNTLSIFPAGTGSKGVYTLAVTNGLGTTVGVPITVVIDPNSAALAGGFVPPTANGNVLAMLPLDGGKALVGGYFSSISDGVTTSGGYLAVMNENGTVDNAAGLSADNSVKALVRQGDGKILVAGGFTMINGVARAKVARLNADLTLDTSFVPAGPNLTYTEVNDVAPAGGGKVLVGGSFNTGWGGAAETNYVSLLNTDGSVDTGFVSTASATVRSVVAAQGGGFYLSGDFTDWDQDGGAVTVNDKLIVKVDTTGALDGGFSAAFPSFWADRVEEQADGSLLVGSAFQAIFGRYGSDGVLDPGFGGTARFNNVVSATAVDGAGMIVAGGNFTAVDGVTRNRLVRLDADGALDGGFEIGMGLGNGNVDVIAVAPNGKIWVGGYFQSYNGATVSNLVVLEGDPVAGGPETYAEYAVRVGLPVGLDGPGDDADGDSWDNAIEWLYGMDPLVPGNPSALIHSSNGVLQGSYLNTVDPGLGLDPAKRYRVVQYRLPKNTLGAQVEVVATRNPVDFHDGSAQVHEYGTPVDEGDYLLQWYYVTPDVGTAPELFWRMEVTP